MRSAECGVMRCVFYSTFRNPNSTLEGRNSEFRILLHPIIDFEIWNATKFLFVIRDQNAVYRKDMRGD